jgi:hypothetical protein
MVVMDGAVLSFKNGGPRVARLPHFLHFSNDNESAAASSNMSLALVEPFELWFSFFRRCVVSRSNCKNERMKRQYGDY